MGIYPTIKGFVLMGHAQIYCHALMEMIFLTTRVLGVPFRQTHAFMFSITFHAQSGQAPSMIVGT